MTLHRAIPSTVAVRIAGRLGMTFFLNHLRMFSDARDLVDGLILLSVLHANVDQFYREAMAGAQVERAPAPHQLRPISINAVANSLSLPYETVRRRVVGLREAGLISAGEQGLIAAPDYFSSERHAFERATAVRRVRNLCLDLADLGILRPLPGPSQRTAPSAAVVGHIAAEYCLRQMEVLHGHVGDVTTGILLIYIIRITTDHLDDTFTEYGEVEDLVRDDLRRPTSVTHLAARAGVPAETARRHAAVLVERGWVARTADGRLHLTRDMLRGPPWPEARRENVANLNRMVAALASHGALAAWGL